MAERRTPRDPARKGRLGPPRCWGHRPAEEMGYRAWGSSLQPELATPARGSEVSFGWLRSERISVLRGAAASAQEGNSGPARRGKVRSSCEAGHLGPGLFFLHHSLVSFYLFTVFLHRFLYIFLFFCCFPDPSSPTAPVNVQLRGTWDYIPNRIVVLRSIIP